jgi:hypothetical protein
MARTSQTIGFAVFDEDRPQLDELVEYFGHGNRSEYLRATLKVMRSVKRAEELAELTTYGQERAEAVGLAEEDALREAIRAAVKGS